MVSAVMFVLSYTSYTINVKELDWFGVGGVSVLRRFEEVCEAAQST